MVIILACYLYIGSSGDSLAVKRGLKFLNTDPVLMKQIMDAIKTEYQTFFGRNFKSG